MRQWAEPYAKEDLTKAVETLKRGGIILYPTDTIWGIGCDATSSEAVQRIYALKQRAESKSMLALVDGLAMLERFVPDVPEIAYDLIEMADKPLTIIYDSAEGIAPNLLAEDGSLGIRVSSEPFSQALCRALRRPIVSTSANISSQLSPAHFGEISQEIIQGVDYVVRYRQSDRRSHPASQIIKLSRGGVFKIIRP